MTWDEINKKYPEYRDEMEVERERQFVSDCFDAYEQEGFANKFWSIGGDFPELIGKPFRVIKRATENDCDIECLPMWWIHFDGTFKLGELDRNDICAYPDEIIPREMKENGCNLSNII